MTQERAINDLSDRLNELSSRLKSREHSATVLEGVCSRMFDALFGWKLLNLNQEQGNFPGVDLGDDQNRVAIQITVQDQSEKATHTIQKIESAKLRERFGCFLCFFLVPKAPGSRTLDPPGFHRLGIRDLIEGILKPLRMPAWLEAHVQATHNVITLARLSEALHIVEETLGSLPTISPRSENLPFRANPHFGQRQEEMNALVSALAHTGGIAAITQPQVVHGLGGVGKTQLAIQYAWQHLDCFTALLWLPADSPASIVTGLARLSETLDLPQQGEREDAVRADATRLWLKQNTGWLLIADNADTAEAQTALLQELRALHGGRILITSRLENWGLQAVSLSLSTWTDAQGAAWLRSRLDTEHLDCLLEDATALSHELGGLPLALEQAAAYMTERRIGPAEYLRRYQAHEDAARRLLDTAVLHGGGTGYEATVARTWLVTLDQMTPLARTIMKMIAWLGPDEIPRFLFTRAPQHLFAAMPRDSTDNASAIPDPPADAVEAALVLLARYGMIDLHEHHLTCHRLVQSTQRWENSRMCFLRVISWVDDCLPINPSPDDVRTWPITWQPMQGVLKMLVEHEARMKFEINCEEIAKANWARTLTALGCYYRGKGQFESALQVMVRALQIDEGFLGVRHPRVAVHLNNLGSLFLTMGRFIDAEPLLKRALEIDQSHYGSNHPTVGIRLGNIAQLFKDTGNLEAAELLMLRVLAIDEAAFGPKHERVADSLNNLAVLLQRTNRLQEAEPLMRRALDIDEGVFGLQHPNVARDLSNLGTLLHKLGRLDPARQMLERALAIGEARYGTKHPQTAIFLNNLAQLLKDIGKAVEAEPLLYRSARIMAERLDIGHPTMQIVLKNYREILQEQNCAPQEIERRMAYVVEEAKR